MDHNLIDKKTCQALIEQRGYDVLLTKIKPLEQHLQSEIGWITVLEKCFGQS